ncbi:hypothetical protein ACWGB8_01730 [Kitasatospora sp. NPDC054939]
MAQRTWPTRDEWAAKAEYSVRTACLPSERVSNKPADWLTEAELAEARTLIPVILKAARAGLNREIKNLRTQLGDIPKGAAYYGWYENLTGDQKTLANQHDSLASHRRQLNHSARRALDAYATVSELLFDWGRVGAAAVQVGAADEQTDRLDKLQHVLAERRDTAAQAALREAIDRTVARRNSDEGWAAELERRAEIDAGPRIIRHPA